MGVLHIHDDPSLRDRAPVFADRAAAGRHLAQMLKVHRGGGALLAAIPAGGVPVAVEMASRLELELEVLPVSKILLPWNTESGFGAVAFDGSVWVNDAVVREFGLSPDAVKRSTVEARSKVEHRMNMLRGGCSLPELVGRSVIIVDDGIAAGSTVRAAISALRRLGAGKVVVAVPTAHLHSVELIAQISDEVWCANIRGGFSFAVADAYESWYDLSDQQVAKILKKID
ncbi:MAG: phosphoribosyltransferase family protein [Gammaproteobacteria bacterium]|nr:phosphoribosyltransferase family protein [Gammaproteobacteria bacterium]MDH3412617.1 phosphoribosyltransferase family protein [Gammaproteobacteria bacterium]